MNSSSKKMAMGRRSILIVASVAIIATIVIILSTSNIYVKKTPAESNLSEQSLGSITRKDLASVRDFKADFVLTGDNTSASFSNPNNRRILELTATNNASTIPKDMDQLSRYIISSESYANSSDFPSIPKDNKKDIIGIGYAWIGLDTKSQHHKESGPGHLRGYMVTIHKQETGIPSSSDNSLWHVESAGFTEVSRSSSTDSAKTGKESEPITKVVYCISDVSLKNIEDVVIERGSKNPSPVEKIIDGKNPLKQPSNSGSKIVIGSNSVKVTGLEYQSGHDMHPLGINHAVYFELLQQNDSMCHGREIAGSMVAYYMTNETPTNTS